MTGSQITSASEHTSKEGIAEATRPGDMPILVLSQPVYPVSEAVFLRLQRSNTVLAAVGGTVSSFGLSYALPIIVGAARTPADKWVWPIADVWIAAGLVAVGCALLTLSVLMGQGRRRLVAEMRQHFERNPGHLEVGVKEE